MVGVPRVELGPRIPETRILPLDYTPHSSDSSIWGYNLPKQFKK